MEESWVLRRIEETAQIGSWVVDIEKNSLEWSAGTYDIHELERGTPVLLEEGINFYIEPHRPIINNCVERGIQSGEPWDVELQIRTTKGNVKWVRAIGEPVRENGELKFLRGVFQDIDKSKKASIDLMVANEKLNLALAASQVGFWDWNVRTDELNWDQQMYRLYGISKEKFGSAYDAWVQGIHPEDQERTQKEVQLALAGEKEFNTEFRVVWENGTTRYIRAFGTVIRGTDGKPNTMIGTNWDITEHKDIQTKLEHRNAELQTVFDAIPGLVIHKRTADDVMVRVNKFAADQMNSTVEKMSGRPSKDFFDEELCEKYRQDDLEVVESGESKLGIIEENHDGEGNKFWIRTDKVPYLNAQGDCTGVVLCAFDISDQIRAQKTLTRLNEELTEFNYRTSHDLKAPLMTISGLTSIMREQVLAGEVEEIGRNLERVDSMAQRLGALVSDLLELTRAEHLSEKASPFDFENEINEIFKIQKQNPLYESVHFETEIIGPSTHSVPTTRMRQVLENLIGNAAKYAHEDPSKTRIVAKVGFDQGALKIEVKDNGAGIAEEYHSQVFEMFKRFHHYREGSGLGLYLTKKHVDAMGGQIGFDCKESGTSFWVKLQS